MIHHRLDTYSAITVGECRLHFELATFMLRTLYSLEPTHKLNECQLAPDVNRQLHLADTFTCVIYLSDTVTARSFAVASLHVVISSSFYTFCADIVKCKTTRHFAMPSYNHLFTSNLIIVLIYYVNTITCVH